MRSKHDFDSPDIGLEILDRIEVGYEADDSELLAAILSWEACIRRDASPQSIAVVAPAHLAPTTMTSNMLPDVATSF